MVAAIDELVTRAAAVSAVTAATQRVFRIYSDSDQRAEFLSSRVSFAARGRGHHTWSWHRIRGTLEYTHPIIGCMVTAGDGRMRHLITVRNPLRNQIIRGSDSD